MNTSLTAGCFLCRNIWNTNGRNRWTDGCEISCISSISPTSGSAFPPDTSALLLLVFFSLLKETRDDHDTLLSAVEAEEACLSKCLIKISSCQTLLQLLFHESPAFPSQPQKNKKTKKGEHFPIICRTFSTHFCRSHPRSLSLFMVVVLQVKETQLMSVSPFLSLSQRGLKNVFDEAILAALEPPDNKPKKRCVLL